MFNQSTSEARGGFVEQKLMLSSNLRCDQIYEYEMHDFGHTLLCYLSQTFMFNKPASEAGLKNVQQTQLRG
jgi:hypothetical protein